jgi:hypothetical protein
MYCQRRRKFLVEKAEAHPAPESPLAYFLWTRTKIDAGAYFITPILGEEECSKSDFFFFKFFPSPGQTMFA